MPHHDHRRRPLYAIVLALLLLTLPACAHAMPSADSQHEAQVKAVLQALAEVIQPAVDLADEACAAQQQQKLAEAKGQPLARIKELEAEATVAAGRCTKLQGTFDQIRELHDQAATLLESGQIGEAENRLRAVQSKWRALRGKEGAAWEGQDSSGSNSGGSSGPPFLNSGRHSTGRATATQSARPSTSSASRRTCRSFRPRVMRLSEALPS